MIKILKSDAEKLEDKKKYDQGGFQYNPETNKDNEYVEGYDIRSFFSTLFFVGGYLKTVNTCGESESSPIPSSPKRRKVSAELADHEEKEKLNQ